MIGLERLSKQADAVVKKTLEAGAEVVEEKVRANLKNSLSGESSGQLLDALGISPVKPNDELDGWDIKIGFNEPRKDDYDKLKSSRFKTNPARAKASYNMTRKEKKAAKIKVRNYSFYKTTNAMVANILEYGKKGQAAKPFMKPAEDATKAKARAKMKKVFTEEANKIVK
jgi:hypothetical protein